MCFLTLSATIFPVNERESPAKSAETPAPQRDGALATGTVFANAFRIERTIGAGAMAVVYEATDLATGNHLALKVLSRVTQASAEEILRFRREGAILKTLTHRSVVRMVRADTSADGIPFMAVELLEGQTWAARLHEQGPMSPIELLRLLTNVADVLDEAHGLGVIHRDLKPENLFLVSDPLIRVKVLDFGLSRLINDVGLTRAGAGIGTPLYMAPEQISSARDAGREVDVYALGVIAYESLTGGISPFATDGTAALLGAIIHGVHSPISAHCPNFPLAVEQVLERAIALKPDARFDTAGEFVAALHDAFQIALPADAPLALIALSPVDRDVDEENVTGTHKLDPYNFRGASTVTRDRPAAFSRPTEFTSDRPKTAAKPRILVWLIPIIALVLGAIIGVVVWKLAR